MKCERCGRQISADESFSHRGQTLCDDCYIDVTSQEQEKVCDPWATYLSTRERADVGLKGADVLGELQKEVYEFIKSKGKATREEIMAKFDIPAQDLGPHLKVIMHAELIKEHSEGDTM